MKRFKSWLLIPTTAAALLVSAGQALSQPTVSTPLSSPVTVEGLSGGSNATSCGYVSGTANQVIQVNQDFASLDIEVTAVDGNGNPVSSLTLMIDGPGFSECLQTDSGSIQAPGLLDRGAYNIYVGDSSGSQYNYTLTISQN
ncbi:MAG: hypothetical protein AAF215_15990 [Cyanobacteria bacterium P01_A01_bin.123]